MKIIFSEEFAQQVGARSMEEFEETYFGKVGTYQRYKNDRDILKDEVKETFITFLFYPLRFLPWGHIMETWWGYFFTETNVHNALDGMAFSYIGDAYVVSLRDAIHGKRHRWTVQFEEAVRHPYSRTMRFPMWLLTRLVWPQFKAIYNQRRKMHL